MIDRADPTATARGARVAGVAYLVVIAGGLFAEVLVRGSLVVQGDAAATARAIAADESLWRWGLAVHLLYLGAAVLVNVLVCELLRPVQATLARLALVFALIGVVVEAVSLVQLTVPLALIEEGGALAALGEGQRQAVAYLAVRLFSTGFGVGLLFFSGFCALTGVLFQRSRLVPRAIGVAMVVAGACYFTSSLAAIVAPGLADRLVPWILVPCFVGELSLALWLALRGVRARPVPAPATG
jgi:hypothetical protein